MKKRKWISLLLVGLCLVSLTSCGKKQVGTPEDNAMPQEETPKEEQKKYVFGFSGITMENPYYITLESAIREAVKEQGGELKTMDPALSSQKQNEQIEQMAEEGIDALFVSPVNWESIMPTLEKIKKKGIKIINVDTEVKDLNQVDAYIGSDNKKAGQICGARLLERHQDGGKVVLLECPTMNSIDDRITGFEQAISNKGFEVIARADAKGDMKEALKETKEILEKHQDVTAIMCGNDQTALGALVAVQSLNRHGIEIYGIDGSPDLKKELLKSTTPVVGTCAQSPILIGKDAVNVAINMLNGNDYEKKTYESVFFIDKDNVDMYGTDGWQ